MLLSLGVACLVGAGLLSIYSTRARAARAAAVAVLGATALVALPLALGSPSPDALWGGLLWPLFLLGAAVAAGAGAGLGLLYVLVEGR